MVVAVTINCKKKKMFGHRLRSKKLIVSILVIHFAYMSFCTLFMLLGVESRLRIQTLKTLQLP